MRVALGIVSITKYSIIMKKLFTFLFVIVAGLGTSFASNYPSGLPGVFSINAHGGQVVFSQGNLQFLASSGTTTHADGTTSTGAWRFALEQYIYLGSTNQYIGENDSEWIDLFGWGTSGYDNTAADPYAINYQPYSSIDSIYAAPVNTTGYGPSVDQPYRGLVGGSAYYDWGIYNSIANSEENVAWRTLSYSEWYYLLFGRPNAKLLSSQASITDIHGYVLLPDNWDSPAGITFVAQSNNWTDNSYTLADWAVMEQAGAVFLPAAGQRSGVKGSGVNSHGLYWTTSALNKTSAQVIHFADTTIYTNSRYRRYYGHAVRLVHEVEPASTITAKFAGFDARGSRLGDWIYNNNGFQDLVNATIEETDTVLHKYSISLTQGGQECSFTMGGIRFAYTNSAAAKVSFKTATAYVQPNGKDRKIIIPTNPGDEILISIADSADYNGMVVEGLSENKLDLHAGDNILHAISDAIVITSSTSTGSEVKPKIDAILCVGNNSQGLEQTGAQQKVRKEMKNGQVLIRRGDKVYTVTGIEVK